MIRGVIIILILVSLCASVKALGYVKPRPTCTEKEGVVIYLDRWQRRDCMGIEVSGGLTTFPVPLYGHMVKVPKGFTVSITTSILFGFTRTDTYAEGAWFTNYALLDAFGFNGGIVQIMVHPHL